MSERPLHRQLGLTDAELDQIRDILGRDPNRTELAMYSVMWSEHCSYKSSRVHLGRLPSDGPQVVLGPGENAGVVDIGDGLGVVVRIESHNHPSYVEPYQGAATGVGGILRDILTMGARPTACFDSLRFGLPVEVPATAMAPSGDSGAADYETLRQRWLANGVVSGISGYGNAVGVPTVGGEILFDPSYAGNPLVNVMALGVMELEHLQRAQATGEGNIVLLIGASTGRDGIGGVSVLASSGFEAGDEEKRPSVQVGDPFEEKKLIEACLELFRSGLSVGAQDLGGAGLTCATSETAAGGSGGMDVDLDAVVLREEGMPAYEILTSESQERMLVVVEPGDLDAALDVCARWEAPVRVVGRVTDSGRLRVRQGGDLVCDVPPASLAEGIRYDRPLARPARIDALAARDPTAELPVVTEATISQETSLLMTSPNLASAEWAYRQYDHQLFLNTVVRPGEGDAAVLRVMGTDKALAVALDGVGRYGRLDPRRGAALAVAEASRNVSAVGAVPIAAVDCMNFGNPEKPEVMWEFSEAVDGLTEACEALGVPIVGGNVSFYNETSGRDIDPTPIVGVVGLVDPLPGVPSGIGFEVLGDQVFVAGATGVDLGGSEWAWWNYGVVCGSPPAVDWPAERAHNAFLADVQRAGLARSVHDVSLGGVAVCLCECALAGGVGAVVDPTAWAPAISLSAALFSETSGRSVLSVPPGAAEAVERLAQTHGVPIFRVGEVGGDRIFGIPLADLESAVTPRW